MKRSGSTKIVVPGAVMSTVMGLPGVAHAAGGNCATPPPAVIVDTDVDFDDTVALAFTPAVREAVGGIIDGAFTSCTASTDPAPISASARFTKTILESKSRSRPNRPPSKATCSTSLNGQ